MNVIERDLPVDIERILAAYSAWLARSGNRAIQKAIVNAKYHVTQAEYDNWDGGQYGYHLLLVLTPDLFAEVEPAWDATRVVGELNKFTAEYPNQYFSGASIALALVENSQWREQSGLLVNDPDLRDSPLSFEQPTQEYDDIWGKAGRVRLFISHRVENKAVASELKKQLGNWGISAFVAHNDIAPTLEWQSVILTALHTCDALLCLLCKDFKLSDWTDQEIGVALARNRFVIPVDIGTTPYGFIGKYQSIKIAPPLILTHAYPLAVEIVNNLMRQPRFKSVLTPALVDNFVAPPNFDYARKFVTILEKVESLTAQDVDRINHAITSHGQLTAAVIDKQPVPDRVRALLAKITVQTS